MKEFTESQSVVLSETFSILLEESEDITYRMYDLFFYRNPQLLCHFPGLRSCHPHLVCLLLNETAKYLPVKIDLDVDPLSLKCLKREHVYMFKSCFSDALKDVLFDDASPIVIHAWSSAFELFFNRMAKAIPRTPVH